MNFIIKNEQTLKLNNNTNDFLFISSDSNLKMEIWNPFDKLFIQIHSYSGLALLILICI
jgi:hypothetical protein